MNDMTITHELGLAAVAGALTPQTTAVDATTAGIDALTRVIELAKSRVDDVIERALGPQPRQPAPMPGFAPPAGAKGVQAASLDRAQAAALALGRSVEQLNRIV